jgi:hypothetical protein
LRERLGHDEGDGLAGIAHRLPGQGELLGLGGHRPVGAADVEGRRAREGGNRPGNVACEVGGRQDEPHPGRGARGRQVDGQDARMGVRGSHHDAVELAGQRDVVREARGAGQEPRILLALQRRADAGRVAHAVG